MASTDLPAKVRYRFYLMPTILLASAIITLTAAFLAATLGRFETVAQDNAKELFAQIVERHGQTLNGMLAGAARLAQSLSWYDIHAGGMTQSEAGKQAATLLQQLADDYPSIHGIYFGFPDGTFLQLLTVRRDALLMGQLNAPLRTHFAMRTIYDTGGRRREHWQFLDRDRAVIGRRLQDAQYDPRERPWYASAMEGDGIQLTEPYLFESLAAPGLTFSHRLQGRQGVVGVDLSLAGLEKFIAESFGKQQGGAVIADARGRILARFLSPGIHAALPDPLQSRTHVMDERFASALRMETGNGEHVAQIGGEPYVYAWRSLAAGPGDGFHMAAFAPMDSFTGPIRRARNEIVGISALVLLLSLGLSYWGANNLRRSLSMLTQEAARLREFDFSGDDTVRSLVYEVDSLGATMRTMKDSIQNRTNALKDAMNKLQALVRNGMQLAPGMHRAMLMRQTVASGKSLCLADVGLGYLFDAQGALALVASGSAGDGDAVSTAVLPLDDMEGGAPDRTEVAGWVVRNRCTLILDLDDDKGPVRHFDLRLLSHVPLAAGQRVRFLLLAPIVAAAGEASGLLVFGRTERSGSGATAIFDPELAQYVELLAAQAAIALQNQQFQDAGKPPGAQIEHS